MNDIKIEKCKEATITFWNVGITLFFTIPMILAGFDFLFNLSFNIEEIMFMIMLKKLKFKQQ